ncbi:MAG TPA: SDR family oxidoreductase [Xanthobacteraceae bacterium]|nr:SDR family oxidoreductase [Xanthobacteraceae bacterium]
MAKRVTLITGASAGIGAALARVFAAHGHELVLVARRKSELDRVADAIAAAGHAQPQVVPIDLGRHEAPARLAADLVTLGLEPEAVVNNAGYGLSGEAAALDLAEQTAMIDLNVRTLTDLSLRWLDCLARHHGGILNVASIAAFMPGPGMAVYHATKAFILSFSEALHQELRPRGVRVTVLCPGPVETGFQARAGLAADRFPRTLVRTSGRVAEDGYDGFVRGRRLVVPGFANQVAALLPRFLSRERIVTLSQAK